MANEYVAEQTSAIKEPAVGMKFGSPDEAFQFYKEYSCKLGFGITRRSSHTYYGFKYDVTFSCNKNRKPPKTNQQEGFGTRSRGILATSCKAHIKLRDGTLQGCWTIQEVVTEHNHDLCPDSVRLMRCHRELPLFVKKQLEINEIAGLAQNKSISAIFTQAGGVTKCTFTERDMRNFVSEIRRLNLRDGDAAALMKYFHNEQARCPNFFYSIDVDDDGRLRNVFWADSRSRSAYKYFSDVITFDTTYLTNRYRMPFAVFVGVNHHGQSILLGCALLSNEFTHTFVWLFESLLTCMHGQPPKALITDQCGSICGAIAEVFPTTRHRLCLWHILKKLPEKLAGVKERDEIMRGICNAVYDSMTPAEFENRWDSVVRKYSLGNNADWFTGLYGMRQKWIPAFVKNQFWAGMSTTQRSESMNAFFDGYINSRTSLKSFVEKFSSALHWKWEKERQEDWRCKETDPKLVSDIQFEKQFAKAYSLKVFYQFQCEIKLLMNCFCNQLSVNNGQITFSVSELVTGREYRVLYCSESQSYRCDCLLFEFRGIVCRHGLCVYRQLRIEEIPSQYILPRWRKDYIRSYIVEGVPVQRVMRDLRIYDDIYVSANQMLQECVEIASEHPSLYESLVERMTKLKIELLSERPAYKTVNPATPPGEQNDTLKDPLVIRSKGRPRNTRIPAGIEGKKKKD